MSMQKRKAKSVAVILGCLLLSGFMAHVSVGVADDHKEHGRHLENAWHKKGDGGLGGILGGGHDEGNETTGQIAAWSLAAANLTVAVSLLIKGIRRSLPLRPEINNSLNRFNSLQKQYLMPLHYAVNPVILAVALLHWMLSRCKSTALPEWGLLTMSALIALGIVLKFKLCPKTRLRSVYNVHTHPAVFLLLFSALVIGHLMVD
jgi:hypothetical protein